MLGPRERFAAREQRARARACPTSAPTSASIRPCFEPFALPSIGIVGTGKRVGKTAITAHAARLLSRDRKVVVVAMGRGGPPEPEVVNVAPDGRGAARALADSGRHAASDHLETAALAGVTTVGCRRCGGGLAGAVLSSNVHEGARSGGRARARPRALRRQRRGAAAGRDEPACPRRERPAGSGRRHRLSERLPPPRLRPRRAHDGRGGLRLGASSATVPRSSRPASSRPRLRPRPADAGRRRASRVLLDRARGRARRLPPAPRATSTARPSCTSPAASPIERRCARSSRRVDAEVFLVELKAAAIDVVAEAAGRERGVEVVLAGSDVLSVAGGPELDAELLRLAQEASA